MAEAVDLEGLKRLVECSFCLQRFRDPKRLICEHHFCKACLEEIMMFKEDGSAIVSCPLGCDRLTHISADETINDLPVSYEVKGFVDFVKTLKIEKDEEMELQFPKCCHDKGCTKVVSIYCCERLFCKDCYEVHKETGGEDEHKRSMNLCFKKQTNTLGVLCEKHGSVCTHLCVDNALLCCYCVHRDNEHKSHNRNTITKSVEFIKEALFDGCKKSENIRKFLTITKEEIRLSEGKFRDLIKTRKEECLLQYTNYLNKQEELLKEEYVMICDKHAAQYCDTSLHYYEEKLKKVDAELVLQKESILETIHVIEKKHSLKSEIVSLSEEFNFMSERPLGLFDVTARENVLVSHPPFSTMKTNVDDIKKKISNTSSTVTIDLQSQLQLGSKKRKLTIASSPVLRQIQPFFDIAIDNQPVRRLIFNMYEDVAPITCRNFISLCSHQKGYGYKGSKVHGVHPGKFCYGGYIIIGNRTERKSFYGKPFQCENHIKKHDGPGLLSMVNNGGYHDSWFFITFNARPKNDGLHVVFGEITKESHQILQEIQDVGGGYRPTKNITIVNCGTL